MRGPSDGLEFVAALFLGTFLVFGSSYALGVQTVAIYVGAGAVGVAGRGA